MQLIIGTDEAGYGPNLGPLVITATRWLVEEQWDACNGNLFELADGVFRPVNAGEQAGIPVGDSKVVLQAGSGLAAAEKVTLPIMFCSLNESWGPADPPESAQMELSWSEFNDRTRQAGAVSAPGTDAVLPWYKDFDPQLPLDLPVQELSAAVGLLRVERPFQVLEPKIRQLEPGEFNAGCDQTGNKASLLSLATLRLIRQAIQAAMNQAQFSRVSVICDKHGGRKSYAGVIQEVFPESWVQVLDESADRSEYATRIDSVPIRFRFQAKGESELPVAVASLFSKYVREVCMRAFNLYWSEQLPDYHSTAGYPVDARRVQPLLAPMMVHLGLTESDWWRKK